MSQRDYAAEVAALLKPLVAQKGRPSVLCMLRDGLTQDFSELDRRGRRFNWLGFWTPMWHDIQRAIGMPKETTHQFGDRSYRTPELEPHWQKAEAFALELFEVLRREVNLVAVMSANFDYGIDEGIRRASIKSPVAFLTLNREIPLFKHQSQFNSAHYRAYIGTPIVDGVAVGAVSARDELLEFNTLRREQIAVTGFPRLDSRLDFLKRPVPGKANSIVLLTYRDADYLAGNNFSETLSAFVEAARRYPNLRFIIKCKSEGDVNETAQMIVEPPENLRLNFQPLSAVLPDARAVIGFNSLAVVEALISQAEVLVPQWGDARTSQDNQIYWRENPSHRESITFLDSRQYFDAAVDEIALRGPRPPNLENRVKLLREILHFDTERSATDAVEEFVDSRLKV